jgi:CTP:molybdopterin cytidylyltransferase MocA
MGGRSFLLRYPERIKTVPVRSEGVIRDIDTWKDYSYELRMKS